jgi:hypothetical protein
MKVNHLYSSTQAAVAREAIDWSCDNYTGQGNLRTYGMPAVSVGRAIDNEWGG